MSFDSKDYTTTYHLVLEPLLLFILPRTAVPTVILIIIFAIGSSLTVPTIIRLLEKAASPSSHEKVE